MKHVHNILVFIPHTSICIYYVFKSANKHLTEMLKNGMEFCPVFH